MKINERWEELREKSNRNIQSERGKTQTRSIHTYGCNKIELSVWEVR